MACEISSGRIVDCKDSVGGIKAVFISAGYIDQPSVPYTPAGPDGTPAAVPGWLAASNDTVTEVQTQVYYQFDVRPETSSLTVNYQSDPASGTTFFEQVLSVTFQKLDATDIADIRILTQGRFQVWVQDNMDNVWLLGAEYGCNVTGGSLTTGQAFSDMSGYTLDMTGREPNPIWIAAASSGGANSNYPLDNVGGASLGTQ